MPSHGSLTKAGKVRSQTPRIKARPRKNLFPRARNRKEYVRFIAKKLLDRIQVISRKTGEPAIRVAERMYANAKSRVVKEALLLIINNRVHVVKKR